MGTIFISYRREESAGHAGRVYDHLHERFGRDRVFMDVTAIEPGADFVETIDRAVGACAALLVVIGPRWLECTGATGGRRLDDPRDFIRLEVATALRRNVRVIPVLVQGAMMPDEGALPEDLKPLARRNAIEINDTHWDSDLAQLAQALERIVDPDKDRDRPQPDDNQTRSRKRLIRLIGSIAAVAAVLVVLLTGIGPLRSLFFSETEITMPDVAGMPEQEAVNRINSLGLQTTTVPRISPGDRTGTVIGQTPPAGARIAKGKEVRLLVAARPRDPDLVTVPNVVRQPLERALQMLRETGLELGTKTSRPLSNVPPGTVVQQMVKGDGQIKVGSQVERGTRVDLWVAVRPLSEEPGSEAPSATPPRKMLAKGDLEVRQTFLFDLDTGKLTRNGDEDLWFQAETATERYLAPRNGATIGLSRNGDYESCSQAEMTERPLPITKLPTNAYVCVRTNQGHLAIFRLREPVGPSPGVLKISYIVWE